MTCP